MSDQDKATAILSTANADVIARYNRFLDLNTSGDFEFNKDGESFMLMYESGGAQICINFYQTHFDEMTD